MTQVKANAILKPYFQLLYDSVVDGYKAFIQSMGTDAIIYDSTTRANMAHNHIFHDLAGRSVSDPRLRCFSVEGLKLFKLDDIFLFKVKKLTSDLKSSNIKSRRNDRFLRQQQLFNEMEPMTHLQLGYVVDYVGAAITDVHIVCPKNENHNDWTINLNKELGQHYVPDLFDNVEVDDTQPDYGLPELTFVVGDDENNSDEQVIQAV